MIRQAASGVRIALEMERRGLGLYNRARMVAKDPALLDLLRDLAADEETHVAIFEAMLARVDLSPLSAEEEALATATAANYFFPGGLMQASVEGALASREAMLDAAIQGERDSIAFYQKLAAHLPTEDGDALRAIVQEEEGHLRALLERKR